MVFDKELVRGKLKEWESLLGGFSFPAWEDFPALPLYMDQVIYLLNEYLSLLPPAQEEERLVTPAMINNYVKLKIIPAPVKKRYGRVHLAYLVIVCALKQALNTSDIRRLMPADLPQDTVRDMYNGFVQIVEEAKQAYCDTVRAWATPVLQSSETPVAYLVFRAAVSANLAKLMSQQLILLRPEAETTGQK